MDLTELNSANQNRHPWELSRASSILGLVQGRLGAGKCADIGAGDLFFARELQKQTSGEILAVDLFAPTGLAVPGIKVMRRIEELEMGTKLDRVFLLDVLEHVPDEGAFLQPILERLAPDALLVITVPAHQWLFSEHDVFLKHFRRYNMAGLVEVLTRNGLAIEKTFYFYHSLFCVRALTTLLGKLKRKTGETPQAGIGNWGFAREHLVTRFITAVLKLDFKICQKLSELGVIIPGLSLCVLCKKKPA